MTETKRYLLLLPSLCLGLLPEKTATAAQWEVKGGLGQQFEYNDNLLLSVEKQSAFGYYLAPNLIASRKTGSLDLEFSGLGNIRRYDDSRLDCEAYTLNLNNQYKAKDSLFALSGGYGTSCSYSLQTLPDGTLVPRSQSQNYQISPSWAWQWTAKDKLVAAGGYSNTSYSTLGGSSSTVQTGNDTYTVNLSDNHLWSTDLTFSGGVSFANINYTGINASTQNIYGLNLGASYAMSPTWSFSVGGGPRWIDTETSVDGTSVNQDGSTTLGHAASLTISYKDQLNAFTFGFNDSVNASGFNQTLQNRSISGNYSYLISKQVSIFIDSSYSTSEPAGTDSTANASSTFDRTYFSASTGIAWQFARSWQLRGSYAYRWQNVKGDATVITQNEITSSSSVGTSESNSVMLSISYAWDGIRDSR